MFQPIIGNKTQIGSNNVHFLQVGRGARTVVLLHGFASLAQEIAAPFVEDENVKFLAFDRPGYGFSDPLPEVGQSGPTSQGRWLAAVLDRLAERSCVVVAHSMGAAPALWLAARRPDLVSRLLLLAPFCRPTRKLGGAMLQAAIQPGIGTLVSRWLLPSLALRLGPIFLRSALFPDPVPEHLEGFPFRHAGRPAVLRTMAEEYAGFQRDMRDFDRTSTLRTRISVIFGTEDKVAHPGRHLDWLSSLRIPVDVTMMPGVGHAPHHARPEAIRAALQAAL